MKPFPVFVNAAFWGALVGLLLMVAWAWPDLRPKREAVICPIPAAHEQLHIVVVQRGGALAAECMYVAPRGAAAAAKREAQR